MGNSYGIRDNKVTLKQVCNGEIFLIVGFKEIREYLNGAYTDKVIGLKYEVIAQENGYKSFTIKVADTTPIITKEELNAKGSIKATAKGFIGSFYKNKETGDYLFTAKADAIEVVK